MKEEYGCDYLNGERVHYNRFYAHGGWRYCRKLEQEFLEMRIIEPLNLKKGMKILEIGCGMGFHSNLLHDLGFDVTGVDISEVGIAHAREHSTGAKFLNIDVSQLLSSMERFDVIFARGMSWYHYELNDVNADGVNVPERTRELFGLLKKKGHFVLQIITDFSDEGRGPGGVHFNQLTEYIRLFSPLGRITSIQNWKGKQLRNQHEAAMLKGNIVIATQKTG